MISVILGSLGMSHERVWAFCIAMLLLVCVIGCSGASTLDRYTFADTLDARKKEIWDWAAAEDVIVQKGEITQSEFWIFFYEKAIELRPDLDSYLFYAQEMTKVSRIFEEGKITQAQLEEKHKELIGILDEEDSRRAHILERIQSLHSYEITLFTCYRDSLFKGYTSDLRKILTQEGFKHSLNHCAVFDGSIQCTPRDPVFP